MTELEGETFFEFNELEPAELKLEIDVVRKFKQVDARIKICSSAIGLNADFNVHFIADLICARCLDTFSKEFKARLHFEYIEGRDPHANVEKVNLPTTDVDRIYYTGSRIDLSIGIREAIVLSLPVAQLCKDNCRGLCPVCGKNKNKEKCDCKIEKVGLFIPVPKKKKDKTKRVKKK